MTDLLERRRHGWFPAFSQTGSSTQYPAAVAVDTQLGQTPTFQPAPYPNTTQAAQNAYTGIGNDLPGGLGGLTSAGGQAIGAAGGYPGTVSPYANASYGAGSNVYNSLFGQAQNPINAGNSLYSQLLSDANGQVGKGPLASATSQFNALAPYVTQALQQGFDPQNALYNQQFQLQQQQNLASNAMSGVGQSPYGAGLTAQANQNFNLDWQQSQLQREATAAQTAGGLSSTAMGDLATGYSTGEGLANTAMNSLTGGYASGQGLDTAAINALQSGLGGYQSLTGLGLSGLEGLLGAGGNALTQSGALQQAQNQQYLAYLAGSGYNASALAAAQDNALNAATSIYGTSGQVNNAQQQLANQQLGGLGSLAGTLGGAAIIGSAL